MRVKSKPNWDAGVRCSVLALWGSGQKPADFLPNFGMPKSTFYAIAKKAQNRGWVKDQPVLLEHVEDKYSSVWQTRPLKAVDTIQQMIVDMPWSEGTREGGLTSSVTKMKY